MSMKEIFCLWSYESYCKNSLENFYSLKHEDFLNFAACRLWDFFNSPEPTEATMLSPLPLNLILEMLSGSKISCSGQIR